MDTAKEWFVTHEGKQFGPVYFDDLKFEVERGELNPRLDLVWKNGMADWIPAGELDGLFENNDEAKAAETAKVTSKNFTGYIPEETQEERDHIKDIWPGVGRGSFFFFSYIFPILWGLGIGFGIPFLQGKVPPDTLFLIPFLLLLLPIILMIAVSLKRFQNLGMSRVWFLGLFVPVLSLWVSSRLIACPPGYAQNRKLDGIGWVLAILYWLLSVAVIAAIAGMAYTSMSNPDKFKEFTTGKEMQQLNEFMEHARERGENLRAPEKSKQPAPEPEWRSY